MFESLLGTFVKKAYKYIRTFVVQVQQSLTVVLVVSNIVINPRRACEASVTVVVVSVSMSVCLLGDISLLVLSIASQTIPRIQCRIKVEKYVGFSCIKITPMR